MEGRQNIVQYRERLDRTLASHDLVDEKLLAALLKDQLLCSPHYETQGLMDKLLEKRTAEVSNFIDMLRSVSEKGVPKGHGKRQSEWKLKEDTEDCRIMYREGPQGTPFHTLLVEGYVDAPMDVCLCVSWESALYKKWWPQFSFPTFKILSCKCLQNIHINEQISSSRIKLSWPLSAREGIVHFFEFEYIQGDLVIVLMNSISDLKAIGGNFGESNDDGTAEENDMVKIDMVGGFALQKVTLERSYFRTIANLDVKMDFVPPWFINFLSRQIIGNGFKLYRKTVASVYKGDEDFSRALESSLYARVRDNLYVRNVPKGMLEPEDLKNGVAQICPKEHPVNYTQADVKKEDHSALGDHGACKFLLGSAQVMGQEANGELREEKDDSFTLHEADGEIRKEKGDSLILPEECPRETIETDVLVQKTCARVEEEEIEQSIQNEKDFDKALGCSLYARVHDALYTSNVPKGMLEREDLKTGVDQICTKEHSINSTQANVKKEDHSALGDHDACKFLLGSAQVMGQEANGEIGEEKDDSFILQESNGEIRKENGDSLILPEECLRETFETDVLVQKTCTRVEEEEIEQSIQNEEDFDKALECSLYARVHDALYSSNVPQGMLEPGDLKIGVDQICTKEHSMNSTQANVEKEDHSALGDHSGSKSLSESVPVIDQEAKGEIREEKGDSFVLPQERLRETIETDVRDQRICIEIEEEETEESMQNEEVLKNYGASNNLKVSVRPEVEQALETLEKVILLVQSLELGPQNTFLTPFNSVDLQAAQNDAKFSEGIVNSNAGTCIEASNNKPAEKTTLSDLQNSSGIHQSSHMGAKVRGIEVHHNRIAPASSPEQNLPLQSEFTSPSVALLPVIEDTIEKNRQVSSEANGINDKSHTKRGELKNQKKQKLCCLPFTSRQVKTSEKCTRTK